MPDFINGMPVDREGRPIPVGLAPQRVGVTLSASGQVIAGVAGKRIRAYAVALVALVATNAKFQSNSTDISGTFPLAANGGAVLPEASSGWFETATGEALNLNLSIATTVGVQVIYELVV